MPGVNVIVGPSDNGKSAILKMIDWLRTNQPGTVADILNWDVPDGKVYGRVITSRGSVSRKRGKGTGVYIVNKEEFRAFGRNVPAEATGVLGLSDLNVQMQLDRHFLILDSPGEVSRQLNRITKLEKLDTALATLRARQRSLGDSVVQLSDKRVVLMAVLCAENKQLLEDAASGMFMMQMLQAKVSKLRMQCDSLRAVLAALQAAAAHILPTGLVPGIRSSMKEVELEINKRNALQQRYSTVNTALVQYHATGSEMTAVKQQVATGRQQVQQAKSQLVSCPYCGSKLTEYTRSTLLRGSDG